jgi:uncharacterized protein (DUF488 family)
MNQATTTSKVFTIGHSTHSIGDFMAILKSHSIDLLVDIRTVPRSRHNPQFNRESLPASLEAAGIGYQHAPGLGGLRRPQPDSTNSGWRNASFRGFADYMQTTEFAENLAELIGLAREKTLVLMCAEAVPWRCHRSLIADALSLRGVRVEHLIGPTGARPHSITRWAKVDGTSITYPVSGEQIETE